MFHCPEDVTLVAEAPRSLRLSPDARALSRFLSVIQMKLKTPGLSWSDFTASNVGLCKVNIFIDPRDFILKSLKSCAMLFFFMYSSSLNVD